MTCSQDNTPWRQRSLTVRRIRMIVLLFVINILIFLALLYMQNTVSNGVRAFIRGEGSWGKAQKQAHIAIINYAWDQEEKHYQDFLQQLRVPLGDRQLRESLQLPTPDMGAALEGFVQGNNAAVDFRDLARVFLWFEHEPHVAEAIAIWTEADQRIAEVQRLAQALRHELQSPAPRQTEVVRLIRKLEQLNDQLTVLEFRFSETLSNAARFAARMGWWGSLLVMAILLTITLLIATRITRSIKQTEQALVESESRFRTLSQRDTLTGLPNRMRFQELVENAILRARRYNRGLALLFLDLDNFKAVNDTCGHDAGDEVLREISTRLTGAVRATDTVARLGGDEFVVLLEELGQRDDVTQIAEVLLECCKAPVTLSDGGQWKLGISIGIACYPEDGTDLETLTKNADTAMYQVKTTGKNGYRFHRQPIDEASVSNA